ncbi:hypothetical protein FSW04_17800 [Baekduia soli]|uniref:DUF1795 domain-containing protein n=1 Tax=Baekduia soli TaxID=496014 RepID=A0A5B8U8G6_9ACTN|nr:hypothetical protein [Baekduia soli]QEC49247.1 hypothetical protein FSW04_17800 [Baekduia soli]
MRRPLTLVMTAAVVAALAAGCGSDSSSKDVPSPATPVSAVPSFPDQGISFKAPDGWALDAGRAPLVATVQAGPSTVAVWRYPRTEKLPVTKDELKAARDALVKAAQARDSTFQVIKAASATIAGKPAVQIRARETIAGLLRTVRSTHIYSARSEIVIDAYSDTDNFRAVDAQVFRPLLKTFEVHAPRA